MLDVQRLKNYACKVFASLLGMSEDKVRHEGATRRRRTGERTGSRNENRVQENKK